MPKAKFSKWHNRNAYRFWVRIQCTPPFKCLRKCIHFCSFTVYFQWFIFYEIFCCTYELWGEIISLTTLGLKKSSKVKVGKDNNVEHNNLLVSIIQNSQPPPPRLPHSKFMKWKKLNWKELAITTSFSYTCCLVGVCSLSLFITTVAYGKL